MSPPESEKGRGKYISLVTATTAQHSRRLDARKHAITMIKASFHSGVPAIDQLKKLFFPSTSADSMEALSQCCPTHLVPDVFEVRLKVLLSAVEESLRLQVRGAEGQEVDGSEPGLLAGGDEDDDGKFRRVLADGVVDRFHHGNQAGGCVGDVEALAWGMGIESVCVIQDVTEWMTACDMHVMCT